MKNLYLLMTFLSTAYFFGQENNVSSGGNGTGTGGSVSFTIGQVDYFELSGVGGSASSGNQIAFEVYTTSLDELINIRTFVYPNPTNNFIVLSFSETPKNNLIYKVTDASGKLLKEENISLKETKISFVNQDNGAYFLSVFEGQKEIKHFKIIKNQ
jgi:hypothetical protein